MCKIPTLPQKLWERGAVSLMFTFQKWFLGPWERDRDILNEKTFQTFPRKGLPLLRKNLYTFQREEKVFTTTSFLKEIFWEKGGEENVFPYFQQRKLNLFFVLNLYLYLHPPVFLLFPYHYPELAQLCLGWSFYSSWCYLKSINSS